MSNVSAKPKLTARELVTKMRDNKGITFNIVSEDEAITYMQNINNYMRVASYRKNFQKHAYGRNTGKYICLDFGYLKELAVLDMQLRDILSKMCLDVEHFMKVRLLYDIEQDTGCDGYSIVKNFLGSSKTACKSLANRINTPFVGDLIEKYFTVTTSPKQITAYDDCPVWVLTEMISYGEFMKFYQYYYDKKVPVSGDLLELIRSLRNGVAHNNCILADLHPGVSRPPAEIKNAVKAIGSITKSQRQKKLTARPILEFVTLLYVYSKVVGKDVREHRLTELKGLFFGRMRKHTDYFTKNDLLVSSYQFVCKTIENFLC